MTSPSGQNIRFLQAVNRFRELLKRGDLSSRNAEKLTNAAVGLIYAVVDDTKEHPRVDLGQEWVTKATSKDAPESPSLLGGSWDSPPAVHAPEGFREYLRREMPAHTVIGDPNWWVDRLWREMRRHSLPLEVRAAQDLTFLVDTLANLFDWKDRSAVHAILHVENAVKNLQADLKVSLEAEERNLIRAETAEAQVAKLTEERSAEVSWVGTFDQVVVVQWRWDTFIVLTHRFDSMIGFTSVTTSEDLIEMFPSAAPHRAAIEALALREVP